MRLAAERRFYKRSLYDRSTMQRNAGWSQIVLHRLAHELAFFQVQNALGPGGGLGIVGTILLIVLVVYLVGGLR